MSVLREIKNTLTQLILAQVNKNILVKFLKFTLKLRSYKYLYVLKTQKNCELLSLFSIKVELLFCELLSAHLKQQVK